MPMFSPARFSILPGILLLWAISCLPAISQVQEDHFFPSENFVQINPTVPNSQLNFEDDSQESCCAKDYTPDGQPISGIVSGNRAAGTQQQASGKTLTKSEFERSNPRYVESAGPSFLVACERFAHLPQLAASSQAPIADLSRLNSRGTLPITSYSTNVSIRTGATYWTDPAMRNTSDFHIETAGGEGLIKLQDVHSYSVCMARGDNVAMVANTDNGSILTYNGNDHIYLAGNNTNMLTRTGDGEDIIELHQARPHGGGDARFAGQTWTAYNIYKTALSGSQGTDTLVIQGTPYGTKWCHIGGYRIYGEYFYVVEFALPPTVTEGPRRQRVNIGRSVEYIVFKGRKYRLNDFLVHGSPVDTIARSVPIGDPLPRVEISTHR